MIRIGIMDSGCGGISVLREIRRILPGADYMYYADNANCPYGEKTREFITERCRTICGDFVRKGADIIVIACNTATSAAIETLRQELDIPIVGMEPAIKPAALISRSGVIGVLATSGTLSGEKYLSMKTEWSGEVKILESVGKGFVEAVESGELTGEKTEALCRESLLPLLEAGADTIVLGCTHYPFLLPTLQKVCSAAGYSGITFIDPAPAVARRVRSLLGSKADEISSAPGSVTLDASGSPLNKGACHLYSPGVSE